MSATKLSKQVLVLLNLLLHDNPFWLPLPSTLKINELSYLSLSLDITLQRQPESRFNLNTLTSYQHTVPNLVLGRMDHGMVCEECAFSKFVHLYLLVLII